jgi:pyruvate/2-oxoglutarate dehydrogenase complex dihydrolipoamide acyltransferase (E2) component
LSEERSPMEHGMSVELRLPDLGEGLEEAEVVRWLVATGAQVAREQAIVEVQTDKATVELPSPVAGVLVRTGGVAGDRVRVGDVLAVIETVQGGPPRTEPDVVGAARPLAAPSVRQLAVGLGVTLADVAGTGPGGRILADDVRRHASTPAPVRNERDVPRADEAAPPSRPAGTGRIPLRGIRRRTAELMAQSWTEIPHITVMDEIDATALLDVRAALREESAAVTPVVFFVAAVARALARHGDANASIDMAAGEIVVHPTVDVGMAVAAPQGLVVPVVRDAGAATVMELAPIISALTERARTNILTPAELAGGTVTVTNYGALGGRFATPLVKPPQSVIVGFGSLQQRPFVVDGAVMARPTLPVVVSADHRLVDGLLASSVLNAVCELLARPVRLLV